MLPAPRSRPRPRKIHSLAARPKYSHASVCVLARRRTAGRTDRHWPWLAGGGVLVPRTRPLPARPVVAPPAPSTRQMHPVPTGFAKQQPKPLPSPLLPPFQRCACPARDEQTHSHSYLAGGHLERPCGAPTTQLTGGSDAPTPTASRAPRPSVGEHEEASFPETGIGTRLTPSSPPVTNAGLDKSIEGKQMRMNDPTAIGQMPGEIAKRGRE